MQWSELDRLMKSLHRSISARYAGARRDLIKEAIDETRYRFCLRFYNGDPKEIPLNPPAAYTWMATTARRLLLRELRIDRRFAWEASRYHERTVDDAEVAGFRIAVGDRGESPERSYEAHLVVHAVLPRLSPLLRDVVRLHDLEGFSLEEISQRTGCNLATIRQRHARAIKLLRNICLQDRN